MSKELVLEALENNDIIFTPTKFSMAVENLAHSTGTHLLEAVLFLVKENELDETQVPKLITQTLKEKIALENHIKDYMPSGVLPI